MLFTFIDAIGHLEVSEQVINFQSSGLREVSFDDLISKLSLTESCLQVCLLTHYDEGFLVHSLYLLVEVGPSHLTSSSL